MYEAYMMFACSIKSKIDKKVRGDVRVKVFEDDDEMKIKISKNGIVFTHYIHNISELIHTCAFDDVNKIVDKIINKYKSFILNIYFK